MQVDTAKERFTVTLKQSLVGASDAAYLQSLFCDLELAEKLRWARIHPPLSGLCRLRCHAESS